MPSRPMSNGLSSSAHGTGRAKRVLANNRPAARTMKSTTRAAGVPRLLTWHLVVLSAGMAAGLLGTSPSSAADTGAGTDQAPVDLTQLPLEALMEIKIPQVYAASKYQQSAAVA